jgi:hypothetical protein
MSEAMLLPCLADLNGDSRNASWKWTWCHCFGKEVQYEIQDITGLVAPIDYRITGFQSKSGAVEQATHIELRGPAR